MEFKNKEEFDFLCRIWYVHEFTAIKEYQTQRFFLNRENFYLNNKDGNEVAFLKSELENLNKKAAIQEKAEKSILFNFEKFYPEKDVDKEFDKWFHYQTLSLENISFLKNKLSIENNLNGMEDKPGAGNEKTEETYNSGVFTSAKAENLFNRLYNEKKESNNQLADFSFIYRRMYKDGYIQDWQKPEVFRNSISSEPYGITLDNKFKTLDRCKTEDKEAYYNIAKELEKI